MWDAIPNWIKATAALLALFGGLGSFVYGIGIERGIEQKTLADVLGRVGEVDAKLAPIAELARDLKHSDSWQTQRLDRLERCCEHGRPSALFVGPLKPEQETGG